MVHNQVENKTKFLAELLTRLPFIARACHACTDGLMDMRLEHSLGRLSQLRDPQHSAVAMQAVQMLIAKSAPTSQVHRIWDIDEKTLHTKP